MSTGRKTALYDAHIKYGGKIVEYAGYLLPVQYSGISAEHSAVRTAAGLFDVSHMGEFILEGEDALANLQKLLVNDYENLEQGRVRYSPMCNENGGIIDDLLVYRRSENNYMIVVNAANREKDFLWIKSHIFGNAELKDISDELSQIALQGPNAEVIISGLCDENDIPAKYYSFNEKALVSGIECCLSRTGYTGERGFEIYCKNADALELWDSLMKAGEPHGLIPCGLGARDTLRLEAGMPLYGHEMTDEITPAETGLASFVKMNKADFIGKDAFIRKGEAAVMRVGIVINGRGIARGGERVFHREKDIGFVTSGTMSPTTKMSIAMGIIEKEFVGEGSSLEVEIRGRRFECEIVKLPFNK